MATGTMYIRPAHHTNLHVETVEADSMADTQDNTQSSQHPKSQAPESQNIVEKEPWGRLFKKRVLRRRLGNKVSKTVLQKNDERDYFDVRGPQFRFGRDPKCEYVVRKEEGIDDKSWNRISKVHFMMMKDMSWEDSPIIIKDLSRNGTFLNGELIGQNQSRLLQTGDIISVVNEDMKVFDFRDLTTRKRVDLPRVIQHKYFVSRKLGSGAFGDVFKLIDRKMNTFAVKYIRGSSITAHRPEAIRATNNEINIMLTLQHVCIIKTHEIIKHDCGGASLILEYMAGGDLLNRIINSAEKRLTEEQARCVFYQVTDALNYLHSKGITHRDIKPDNVLMKDNAEMTLVKLSDFGLSKLVTEGTVLKSLLGTPNYVAPEVIKSEISQYNCLVDVWSMGVMLFAMISGTLPFAEDYGDVQRQIITGKYAFMAKCWKEISPEAISLIRKMLVVDPKHRLKTDQILQSSWMHPRHFGVQKAKTIMQDHGHNVTPSSQTNGLSQLENLGKENEFAVPKPPAKRARYQL